MASRGINKVLIIGNLGADPEVRYTQNSTAIATISVATSETWKDKQSGQQREETEWHRVVCYRRLAEIAGEYLRKGSKVYIEGRLRTRKWQGQDGKENYTTEIVCNDMQMLDGRSGQSGQANHGGNQSGDQGNQNGHSGGNNQNPAYTQGMNAQQPNPRDHQSNQNPGHPAPPDFDDDIMF